MRRTLIALTLLAIVALAGTLAATAAGMMGVGRMMGAAGGGPRGGGFAIVTESSSPLTTESDDVLVTENHP